MAQLDWAHRGTRDKRSLYGHKLRFDLAVDPLFAEISVCSRNLSSTTPSFRPTPRPATPCKPPLVIRTIFAALTMLWWCWRSRCTCVVPKKGVRLHHSLSLTIIIKYHNPYLVKGARPYAVTPPLFAQFPDSSQGPSTLSFLPSTFLCICFFSPLTLLYTCFFFLRFVCFSPNVSIPLS